MKKSPIIYIFTYQFEDLFIWARWTGKPVEARSRLIPILLIKMLLRLHEKRAGPVQWDPAVSCRDLGMAGQTFSHVNTLSRRGGTKNINCACVGLFADQNTESTSTWAIQHGDQCAIVLQKSRKTGKKPVNFQLAKCFYSYTTKKLFSSDKYLSEASLLKN